VAPEPPNEYNQQSTFVKIMEYMAVGKPIVSFDLAETRLTAGGSAIYVGANDEREFTARLSELMDNPGLRSEMGRRGEGRIRKQLAWEYSVPKLLDAYTECLKTRPSFSTSASRTRL
jgi:glycosyltransferase involved in cell wall biosynthesis